MQKIEWFGMVRSNSRSSAMSPFDKAHTTSYSTLIENMRLSCTVFEIYRAICRTSLILTDPAAFSAPAGGNLSGIPLRSLASKNWSSRLLCDFVCVILYLAVLVEHRLVTDRQTQTLGIYRASIASRGKNKKLSYRRGTARCVVSIEILLIATQQCRNYLYDKS